MKTKLLLFFIACSFMHLSATNFNVTNGNDDGAGSLRQAITDANADATATASAPHTIITNGAYTITLASVLPTLSRDINLNATGTNVLTINAVADNPIIKTTNGKTITLNYLTLQGLTATTLYGGALIVGSSVSTTGSVTVNNCIIQNNSGITPAILNFGNLNCNNTTIQNNTVAATSGTVGGTVYTSVAGVTVNFANCIVQNNTQGVAIRMNAAGSTLNITNCIVKNNSNEGVVSTSAYGGGIGSAGVTTITNTEISGNSAIRGAGIYLATGTSTYKSKLTMVNCTMSGNNATLGSNTAYNYGGALWTQAGTYTDIVTLTNCTVSGNVAAGGWGGGLRLNATTTYNLNNCTITGNKSKVTVLSYSSGGGMTIDDPAIVNLNYCIVLGNNVGSTSTARDISNLSTIPLGSATGNNMFGDTQTFTSGAVTTGNVTFAGDITTIFNTTLTDNGGTTSLAGGGYVKTHALLTGSSAINPTAASSGLQTKDQRGYTRDAAPDMGALEFNGTVTYLNTVSKTVKVYQSGLNSIVVDLTEMSGLNTILIYDVQGKIIANRKVNGGEKISFVNNFKKGVYIVRIQNIEKQTVIKLSVK